MSIQRTTILRGPAKVTFNSATFFSKDDVAVSINEELLDISTSAHGKVDDRFIDRSVEVTFTPSGEWENLATLFPYGSTTIGASIFTGTDKPLVIHSVDGRILTLKAAAVTRMPDIILSATKTLIGQITFTGIGADNTAYTVDESLVADAASAYSDTTFAPASIIVQPYSLAWGASPWNAFQTLDGVVVSFDLSLAPLRTDTDGLVDMMFERLAVTARCIPLTVTGLSLDNVIDAMFIQGTGATRGHSLNARTNTADLVISGTGVTVTVKKAALRRSNFRYGATTPRLGEIEFVATRQFTAGVGDPLFAVA